MKTSVALVDIDPGGGVLRKEVPDGEIDVGDDGPQADGIPPVGLIGIKLADLLSSGQGGQSGGGRGDLLARGLYRQSEP